MTSQEEQLLNGLIQRVQQTQLPEKDNEAELLLQRSLAQNPDALYILCQTVLVQQYALEQGQKQLSEARQQLDDLKQGQATAQPEHHTSFLGNLFGGGTQTAPAPVARPNAAVPPPEYAPVPYPQQGSGWSQPQPPGYGPSYGPGYGGPPPAYGQPYGAPPQYAPASSGLFGGGGFGGGGFLQGALQTAAGVAAGEMAFRGIEDLMHGFGQSSRFESDRALGGLDGRPEVVNNYYGDEHKKDDSFGDRLQAADGDKSGLSSDIEDRRGERQGFMGDSESGSREGFTDQDIDQDGDSGSEDLANDDNLDNGDAFDGVDDSSDFDSGNDS